MSMSQNYTEEQVKDIVRDYIQQEFMYDMPGHILDNNTLLVEEGIIDSLGIFRLISFLQEQFELTVEPEDVVMEHFESINAIGHLCLSYNKA